MGASINAGRDLLVLRLEDVSLRVTLSENQILIQESSALVKTIETKPGDELEIAHSLIEIAATRLLERGGIVADRPIISQRRDEPVTMISVRELENLKDGIAKLTRNSESQASQIRSLTKKTSELRNASMRADSMNARRANRKEFKRNR